MVLPTKVVLALPMDDDEFSKIKNLAEKSQAVVLEITRRGKHIVGFKDEGEWLFGRPPMYHVHQAIQWANQWEHITWDWSHVVVHKEVLHANDIYMALEHVGYSLKSLKLSNMSIDGTMTDMKNLTTAIKKHAMESIEFSAVYGVDQRARDLLPTLIPSLWVQSLEFRWCDWATSHLELLPFPLLYQLELHLITLAKLKPVLDELCDEGGTLKTLTIRFLHSDGDTTDELGLHATLGNRLAEVMLQNKTLERLSFPIMRLSHSLPVLKALESTNRTLKDVNFRFAGEPWDNGRNPTKQELEELNTNVMSGVLTANTAIEHIRFSDYKGNPVDFWPLREVEYYLKLNREGMRSELLKGYGENDHKWWDTLVRNNDNCDISFSFLLLKNNFRAFFGNTQANENRLVALFAKRKHDKDNENNNNGSDSPDKKRQRVQAVDS